MKKILIAFVAGAIFCLIFIWLIGKSEQQSHLTLRVAQKHFIDEKSSFIVAEILANKGNLAQLRESIVALLENHNGVKPESIDVFDSGSSPFVLISFNRADAFIFYCDKNQKGVLYEIPANTSYWQ